jgi:hypothetical protein
MQGVTIVVEESSGDIISVSTRTCPDKDRWKSLCMPILKQDNNDETHTSSSSYDFTTTQVLDLHNSRYLHTLHPTIHIQMPQLRQLVLTRCDRLQGLPDSIGSLQCLQEVRQTKIKSIIKCGHNVQQSNFFLSMFNRCG